MHTQAGLIATAVASAAGPRAQNQDRVAAREIGRDRALIAVADGMGGHAAGEVASDLTINGLLEATSALAEHEDLDEVWFQGLFTRLNGQLREHARAAGTPGMGTTLTCAVATPTNVWIAHVGDSRLYRIDDRGVEQCTQDHSAAADAVRRGLLSDTDARGSRYAHALTRALGTDEHVEADVARQPVPRDCEGVIYLACSDGVWNVLSDASLERLTRSAPDLESAAVQIIQAALAHDTADNASVALLELGRVARGFDASGAIAAMEEATRKYRRPRWGSRLLLLVGLAVAGAAVWSVDSIARSWADAFPRLFTSPKPTANGLLPLPNAAPSGSQAPRLVWLEPAEAESLEVAIDSVLVGWTYKGSPLAVQLLPATLLEAGTGTAPRIVVSQSPHQDTIKLSLEDSAWLRPQRK